MHTFFSLSISSNIHRYYYIFHEFKAPKKFITSGTFNIDFHNDLNQI